MKASDRLELLKYAYLCGLAYSGNGFDKFGYELKYAHNTSNQFYIIENDEECIVVFRGTDDGKDMLSDVNILFADTSYGRIHQGFFNIWLTINYELRARLPLNKKVYFTGHSLGGALAQIAGLYIVNDAIITFGSPMIHHYKDTHLIKTNHIRVRNCNDIVTKLPPVYYKHTGNLIYIDYSGNIKSKISALDFIKGHLKAWSKRQLFKGVYDHNLRLYQNKLADLSKYEY